MKSTLFPAIVALTVSASPALAATIEVVEMAQDVTLDIYTYPGHATTIDVGEKLTQAVVGNDDDYWLRKPDPTYVILDTKIKQAPPTNVNLKYWSGNAVIRVRPAASPDDATLHIRFVHPQELIEPEKALDSEHRRSLSHRTLARYAMQTTSVLVDDVRKWHKGSHKLEVRTSHVTQGKTVSVFPFALHNLGYDYPITRFELRDHLGKTVTASFHTVPNGLGSSSVLERGKAIQGAFVFEAPVALDKGWQLHLFTTKGIPPAEFIQGRQREFEPGMLELRTMVSVHGLGGVSQLSDNMGRGQSTWAPITGAGVQASYGPSKRTAIVGGIDFVRTAESSIDMSPGLLDTRATGGRVHLGGRLHTGERIVPYASAGLGLLFANHTFSMGDGRASELRVAALFGLGGGIEAWLGERVVVGLGINSTVPIGGNETGLVVEAGLRIGVAFGKLRDHWSLR